MGDEQSLILWSLDKVGIIESELDVELSVAHPVEGTESLKLDLICAMPTQLPSRHLLKVSRTSCVSFLYAESTIKKRRRHALTLRRC